MIFDASRPRLVRRCALWLFFATAGLYVTTGDGFIHPSDGVILFHVTESLQQGRLDIDELPKWPGFGGPEITDPATGRMRLYSKYGLGTSLAALPLDVAGRAAAHVATAGDRDVLMDAAEGHLLYYPVDRRSFPRALRAFFASETNAFVVAATLALLFLLLTDLGFDVRIALISTALVGVGTPLWQAATDGFSEPLGALGVIGCALFARRKAWFGVGVLLGIAVLAKPAHAVLAIPVLALVLAHDREAVFRRLLKIAAGTLAVLSLALAYNAARFGTPFETGYGAEVLRWENPFWTGLAGLLVSPGRGFFLYTPLWLLMIPAAGSWRRRFRPEAIYGLLAFAVFVLTYSKWHMWEGGWCWGPRYLVPILPLLGIPAAIAIEQARSSRARRWFVGAVAAASVAVAWSGTRVDANDFSTSVGDHWKAHAAEYKAAGISSPWGLVHWDWGSAPLLRYWTFTPRRPFLLGRVLSRPGVILGWLSLWAFAFVFGAIRLWRLTRDVGKGGEPSLWLESGRPG